MEDIILEKSLINQQITDLDPNLDWKSFTCFYKKRPRRGKNWQCKTKKGDEFKRRKKAKGCSDLLSFDFIYESVEDEQTIESAKAECNKALVQGQELEEKLVLLDKEFDGLAPIVAPQENIRKSGEAVVLDLLQTAEAYTANEGNPQVYVATGSSIEKENAQKIISDLKIDFQKIRLMRARRDELIQSNANKAELLSVQQYLKNPIESFSLWIEFGLNYSGGTRSLEYSVENGGIKDLKLIWTGPNPMISFKIVNDDFWIQCDLDITNDDPTMGYRAVGEVFAHYPDGSITRGGMKLEFDNQ